MIASLLLLLMLGQQAPQADIWAQVWTELETLRSAKISEGEASVLRSHLADASEVAPEGPRADLLRATLEALSGRDARAVAVRLAGIEPSPFTPRELWFLADLIPAGSERARIVSEALRAPTTLSDWQVLLAWNTAVDEARGLRMVDSALPIQAALHERFQAPWSAEDLAQTYKALGERAAADQVLAGSIATEEAAGKRPGGLWERRGINALGFGDEPRARDYLGRALALGSDEAGLVLSRLDLVQGKRESARRGFRARILGAPPSDWAWRGWGSSLLPEPYDPPASRPQSNE